jgi:short-subunit dehydrogenase
MRGPFRAIVVTGASSGLGAALAEAYAAPGVALALLGRDRQRLGETADVCETRGAEVRMAAIDVADAATMAAWLIGFDRDHPVDLVIANAGTSAGPEPDKYRSTCSAPSTRSSRCYRHYASAGAGR